MQTQKITLDFCQNDYKTVTVKQYDKDSRNLIITCTDNGSFYKLDSSTLQCNVKMITPDDRAIYDTATINENGTVLVTFSESMVYASGTGKLEIQFLDLSTKKSISTMILTVIIVGSVYSDDKIIASDEFNALIDTLVEVENSVNATNEAIERMNAFEESISVAEAVRAINEESRVLAENDRIVAEESRISAENNRANKENMRINTENIRVANEESRILAENNRVNEENTRIDAENIRITNETLRQSQEDIRQSNDALREVAVSTAVAKSEEAITIAKGKNRASVFPTISSMQEALADESNKGSYQVGDNLYIVDTKVPDYWIQEVLDEPDSDTGLYYKISELETQKVDLSDINLDALVESVAYISDESDVEASIGAVLTTQNIIDNVDSSSNKMVLSANQGKILNDKISIINEDVIELQNAKDVTTTTSTTMPNTCEGRLRFKEIRGKTEKLTSTGKNLLNLRDGVNAVGDGVTYTNRGDGTYSRVGTATGITGNAWIKGGYVEGVSSTEITNPIMTLKLGKSYFIGDCVLFSVTKDGVSYGVTGAVTVQNEDAKIVGIRNTGQLVGYNYNDVIYPRVFEGLVDLGWEPYGVGTPFIRSTVINGIKTHGKNLFDYSKAVNGYITTNDGEFAYHPYVIISDYIPSNGNVTVSLNKSVIAIAINCFDSSNNFISKNIFENCSVATLESVENCAYVRVAFTVDESDIDITRLLTYEPMVNEGDTALPYEPYSVATFSKPIELNKIGDVQDVIVDGKPIRRITKKRITSGMAIEQSPDWANKQAFLIDNFFADGVQVYDAKFTTVANIMCTHAPTSSASEIAAGSVMNGVAQNLGDNVYFSFENCATLDAVKTFLDNNVVEVYYELATPITSLPTADQVALNSLETFDGITYLEIDSPLQPEFVAEYGTSKVGGVALEAKGESQANSENINRILQDAFIPRETTIRISDANTCLKSGIYRTYDETANAKYTNGFLLVFAIDPNMVIQINTLWSPQYIAIRTHWWGTWHPWCRIATEVDISALETAMVNNI